MFVLVVDGSPAGTAFAIGSAHVITAYHNLYDDGNKGVLLSLSLTKEVIKRGETLLISDAIKVKIVLFDEDLDWAILEIEDRSQSFPERLCLADESELNLASMSPMVLHAPIGLFLKGPTDVLHIWKSRPSDVQQFDGSGLRIMCEGGLHSGSSGSPYVLPESGKVLAMHLGSIHQSIQVNKRTRLTTEKILKHLTEQSEVHASAREGLVLCRVPKIVDFVNKIS